MSEIEASFGHPSTAVANLSTERPATNDRRPAGDVIASELRVNVLAGKYPPGTPMRESILAPAFGVSRTTMREALRHLVDEGIVTYYMNRGTLVTDIAPVDVADLYAVRIVLELAAVSAAAEQGRKLSSLRGAARLNARAARRNDVAAALETDMAFHREIVALLASPRISGLHDSSLGQLRIALNLLDRSHRDQRAQADDHSQIVNLLEVGDHSAACKLLRSHLEAARDNLVLFLSNNA